MSGFIVTFPIGGPLSDHYTELAAHDELSARLALIGVYGRKGWAGIYPDDEPTRARIIEDYNLTPVEFGFGHETAEQYAS